MVLPCQLETSCVLSLLKFLQVLPYQFHSFEVDNVFPLRSMQLNALEFALVVGIVVAVLIEDCEGGEAHVISLHRYNKAQQIGMRESQERDNSKEKAKEDGEAKAKEAAAGAEAVKAAPRKVKTWFVQLSFWKKIIIIFTLNTLILLILTDAIMLVLFGKISDDIVAISNQQKEQFNQVANTQIVAATAKMALSKIDLYAGMLSQLASTYYYFTANPQLYTNLETASPALPQLTSSFPNATYSQPAIYYLTQHSAFVPLPFLDELLGKMIQTPTDMQNIKRINVFVVNGNQLTARTVPATNQFTIPSFAAITNRFAGIPIGNFTLSAPYIDSLTTASSPSSLLALRTVLNSSNAGTNLYLEVELVQSAMMSSLQGIYYFPSAAIMIAQRVDSNYIFYTPQIDSALAALAPQFYPLGTSRLTLNGQDYVTASVGLSNQFTLGKWSTIGNNTNDPLRCIMVVRAAETERPAIQIQSFLSNESNILKGIVFCWSFIILLSTVALATVVGNYIFSNLKMLSTKMEEYIKDPSRFHLIVIQLKQLELKGILKKLSDNLIGIIEKIEVRKRERKDRINQNYHPLSIGEPKFQERQQLNDYEIIEEIKEEVRIKVEAMKKEAEEKEKIEKEKTDKQKERIEKEKGQTKPAEAPQPQKKNN